MKSQSLPYLTIVCCPSNNAGLILYYTIKQIVRFQERMHHEKFQVDKIQNGRLLAIIHSTGLILWNIMKIA